MRTPSLLFLMILSTIAYAQLVPDWVQIFPAQTGGNNSTVKMVVDQSGNMYVTGRSTLCLSCLPGVVTIKYNSNGTQAWLQRYEVTGVSVYAVSILIDDAGNSFVLASTYDGNNMRLLLLKYNGAGILQWDRLYSHPGMTSTYGRSFARDVSSNIYITGRSTGYYDSLFVLKYNSAGAVQWARTYTGTNAFYAEGNAVVTDNLSNAYITGRISNSASQMDAITLKYNTNGILQWVRTFTSPQTYGFDGGYDITLDNSSNVYITGVTGPSAAGDSSDVLTIKYNSSGVQQWVVTFDTVQGRIFEWDCKILTDNGGYPHVLANIKGDIYTVKYNTNGARQWLNKYTYGPSTDEQANSMMLDEFGNVLVGGTGVGFYRYHMIILKYLANGPLSWVYRYNYTGVTNDGAVSIGYLPQQRYFAAGYSGDDMISMKLSLPASYSASYYRGNLNKPIQNLQFVYDTIYVNVPEDSPLLTVISDVNVLIDTVLHTYDSDLEFSLIHQNIEDTIIYRVGGTLDNFIGTRLDDSATNFIGNGPPPYTGNYKPSKPLSQFNNFNPNGTWILRIYDRRTPDTGTLKSWGLTIRYDVPIGIKGVSGIMPEQFVLHQNYPNPFNPVAKIRFDVPHTPQSPLEGGKRGVKGGFITLKVYDILGKEITTLVNEPLKPGSYEVEWDASNHSSGAYFYRLTAGEYAETRKMVLLK